METGTMSLGERVYAELRQGIVDGRYRPLQRLVELELAEELSASRTPVREALQHLELEGLVLASRHGWIVREHTAVDIHNIYDVRIALEGYASRLAAERASDEALSRLRAIHESALSNLDPGDRGEFVRLHDEFHAAILRAAENEVLGDAIRSYREHPSNRRVAHSYSVDELRAAAESHTAVLEAICGRAPDEAERLTREHLQLSLEATIERFAVVPGFIDEGATRQTR
jgi:DNA-binding GntR family transcriptional regulator